MTNDTARKPGRTTQTWAQAVALALFFVLALLVSWRWDWLLGIVQTQASSAIGRQVRIAHVHVHLGPITQIELDGITIANPDGFTATDNFATIDRIVIEADLAPYIFHQQIVLPAIEIDHPTVAARQLADGQNNYTLQTTGPGSSNSPAPNIGDLIIIDGHGTVVIPKFKTNAEITIATRNTAGSRDIVAGAHGTYSGQPITAQFVGGALLTLRDPSNPYQVNLHIQNGSTRASLVGTITDPAQFSMANLTLSVSGQDMSDLYQLTGIPIPATPPYNITGKLDYTKNAFRFENFTGRVGSSDLEGTIAETAPSDGSRHLVTADLTSRQVDLRDLAGFLGAEPGSANTPGADAATKAAEIKAAANPKLLPNTPIDLPKIKITNIELNYKGAKIINRNVPMDNVVAHLSIENGEITLHPLNFAVGSGTIASTIDLNPVDGVLHTKADVDFRHIPLARVMAATHAFAGDGVVGGTAHLTATGNSLAQMLGHGNGKLNLFMDQGGDVSALLVDLAGLQAGDALFSALGIPNKTKIQCIVSGFTLTNGQINTDELLIATSEANILASGTANLTNETLNLTLHTDATHVSIGSLSTPINIAGTLKHPSILPAAAPLAERIGSAVGLGLLFPPLALLPTIRLGVGDQNACSHALQALSAGHGNPRK